MSTDNIGKLVMYRDCLGMIMALVRNRALGNVEGYFYSVHWFTTEKHLPRYICQNQISECIEDYNIRRKTGWFG